MRDTYGATVYGGVLNRASSAREPLSRSRGTARILLSLPTLFSLLTRVQRSTDILAMFDSNIYNNYHIFVLNKRGSYR